jgi:5-formaminoimidazole-4-carboxamide-1-beta-D-ribofuranosyl 5'-monophosphate synthetase
MKEIKDFFEELEKLASEGVIDINEAKRLVSEAYVAGINFQAAQNKK